MKKRLLQLIQSLLLILLTQSISVQAYSKPLILNSNQEQYTLAPYLELLEDKDANLTIEDTSSSKFSHLFIQNQSTTPSFGYTDSAYWVRFNLTNPSKKEMRWYLELDYPTTNFVDFFTPVPNGTFNHQSTGDHYPFSQREMENRNFVFSITIPSQTSQTYFLRVQSTAVILPLKLWQLPALNHKMLVEYSLLGIYIGGLLIIAVYNLFIFSSVKEKAYLYYVLYTLGFALTESALNGTAFQFLWPDQVWWANRMIILAGGFSVFWGFQFSRIFIDTPQFAPRLDKVLLLGMGLTIIFMTVCLFNYSLGNQLISSLVLVTIPLLLISGYICLKKGSYTAKYYIWAWVLVVSGVIIHLLKTFGFLPANIFTNWADELGSLAEVSLLSYGLAARINRLKHAEKEKSRDLFNKNSELEYTNQKLREYEVSLEQKISDRTRELDLKNEILNNAMDEVKLSNLKLKAAKEFAESAAQVKSEFLSNISHELRTPMQGILGYARLGIDKIENLNKEKVEEFFNEIYLSGIRLLGLLNNLLDLSKLESDSVDFSYIPEKLSNVTTIVMNELYPVIIEKDLKVNFDSPSFDDTTLIDVNKIGQVVRNLLGNAIKFSKQGGRIEIAINLKNSQLQLTIADNGIGIPGNELETIFDHFVQSSKSKTAAGGTGLGLAISKKIIENHQGKIWAEQNPDGGAIFNFQIPVQQALG